MAIVSHNPSTGETLRTFTAIEPDEIDDRIARARLAFDRHRSTSFQHRAAALLRAADLLEGEEDRWARLMTMEMGKPLAAALAEARKCATACRYYAHNAERFLGNEMVDVGPGQRAEIRYQPLGVILAVMPWNFPFWQAMRFAAPALMAGNVGLLKHASNVPQCALALEEIFRRAGFGADVFQTLLIGSGEVERVLRDRRIAAATLTGSEAAGQSIGSIAGDEIKKTVLELGGSDPFIVMPSADLEAAVATAVKARVINNGQSCIAAKRFIVHEAVADAFIPRFVAALEALTVGDPTHEETDIGPLASQAIREDLVRQIEESVRAGARVLTGGTLPEGPGYFFPPTAVTDIPPGCPAYDEELFGPVAAIFRVKDLDQAVSLANDTSFGLGAAAWTSDAAEAERFAVELEAGQVFLNGMVASDPRLPFGGVKRSGYGRELGVFGIREFVNIKTVVYAEGGGGVRTG
ncbi:MAG TPA: NAD-dependent succinate-semialdehyde dehydrogenase [Gemmatimonadaceae bacterium]|nr:NAD-dependent succinate-semialdehyde dehydrogenase [Gemmatimonadaceae bacterium]